MANKFCLSLYSLIQQNSPSNNIDSAPSASPSAVAMIEAASSSSNFQQGSLPGAPQQASSNSGGSVVVYPQPQALSCYQPQDHMPSAMYHHHQNHHANHDTPSIFDEGSRYTTPNLPSLGHSYSQYHQTLPSIYEDPNLQRPWSQGSNSSSNSDEIITNISNAFAGYGNSVIQQHSTQQSNHNPLPNVHHNGSLLHGSHQANLFHNNHNSNVHQHNNTVLSGSMLSLPSEHSYQNTSIPYNIDYFYSDKYYNGHCGPMIDNPTSITNHQSKALTGPIIPPYDPPNLNQSSENKSTIQSTSFSNNITSNIVKNNTPNSTTVVASMLLTPEATSSSEQTSNLYSPDSLSSSSSDVPSSPSSDPVKHIIPTASGVVKSNPHIYTAKCTNSSTTTSLTPNDSSILQHQGFQNVVETNHDKVLSEAERAELPSSASIIRNSLENVEHRNNVNSSNANMQPGYTSVIVDTMQYHLAHNGYVH